MYVSEKELKGNTQKYKSLCCYGGPTYFSPYSQIAEMLSYKKDEKN